MKYRNRKVSTEDGTFDSVKEFSRWQELKMLQRAGMIRDLRRQVPFVLIPAQRDETGKVIERECRYVADFVYMEHVNGREWVRVVEDTKSSATRTKDYIIKRKLMLRTYGIRIQEV